jgi:DNA-binding transcriptional ArsR family regulator
MKIKQAVKSLAALAQESRLNVFRLLVEAGEEGLSAGEISERLNIPPATMSFHLKELTATGLIAPVRNGRSMIYSLKPDVMNELLQFLMQDCCQGRPELCQPEFTLTEACCKTPKAKVQKKTPRNRNSK